MIKTAKKPVSGGTHDERKQYFLDEKNVLNLIIANSQSLLNDLLFDREHILDHIDDQKKQLKYLEWMIQRHDKA